MSSTIVGTLSTTEPRASLQLGDSVDLNGRATTPPADIIGENAGFALDNNAAARRDYGVAPWLELEPASPSSPPSPPPKGRFGFSQKISRSSLRNGSTTTLTHHSSRPSDSFSSYSSDTYVQSVAGVPSSIMLTAPDWVPQRELRKAKSSLSMLSNIIRKKSRSRLRPGVEDPEHPSLRPKTPPLPIPPSTELSSILPLRSSSPQHPSLYKERAKLGKKKKDSARGGLPHNPPSLPNQKDEEEIKLDTNFDEMDGIVDRSFWSTANGASGSGSPSSIFDSSSHTRSLSVHSYDSNPLGPIPHSDFHNPFQAHMPHVPPRSSSIAASRQLGIVDRKISPKTIIPARRPLQVVIPPIQGRPAAVGEVGTGTDGQVNGDGQRTVEPESPSWVPPESWEVVEKKEKEEEEEYSSSEDSLLQGAAGTGGGRAMVFYREDRPRDSLMGLDLDGPEPISRRVDEMGRRLGSSIPSSTSMASVNTVATRITDRSSSGNSGSGVRSLPNRLIPGLEKRKNSLTKVAAQDGLAATVPISQKRPTSSQKIFTLRIYRANNTYHVVQCGFQVTVATLTPRLNAKLLLGEERETHRLYLKERGRERILGQTERPADIVRRRLEQAGYDVTDGLELLGGDSLAFLLKFVYKSELLGPTEQNLNIEFYDNVDLSGRGLRTIPVALHKHADQIVALHLSRNPMLDIPLDFIQSCTTLKELRLSQMAMKKVPRSLKHCTTLHRLDISCNRIGDLDDAYLEHIPELKVLLAQNNRMEKLPWHFPRLRALTKLNISNNKFRSLSPVVCQLENLRDLDISFNMIVDLPDEIGLLRNLEHLIMVGNQISKIPNECCKLGSLRRLDCRRNMIADLNVISMLPKLEKLSADHNALHGLALSLGPLLTTIDASHNEITQISLIPGPVGKAPYSLISLDVSHAKLSSLDDIALAELSSLRILKLDHNSLKSLPETLGSLKWLETLSCADNELESLPSSIGCLQKLQTLDLHSNSLSELPVTLWNCAFLRTINATSNLLDKWHYPVAVSLGGSTTSPVSVDALSSSSTAQQFPERKASAASLNNTSRTLPPLAHSLEKLFLGENQFTDDLLLPLTILKELKVLNLSFNAIQDLPSSFLRNFTKLEELYLSGNRLTSIPTEDLPKLKHLTTLFLNGNKLQTLPQELGKVQSLMILDVGSNLLKYNISNWEFDWNWNFNKNLKYLNLSGNKKLQIKSDTKLSAKHPKSYPFDAKLLPGYPKNHTPSDSKLSVGHLKNYAPSVDQQQSLAGFTELTQLRVLGLMDVTIPCTGGANGDIPDESEDRRVRTSDSTILGMAYGIADTLGKNGHLHMFDLVHAFQDRPDEAVIAMFGRAQPPKAMPPGVSGNRVAKYLRDKFVEVFTAQLNTLNPQRSESIPDALRRSFLKINQNLHDWLFSSSRKQSAYPGGSTADIHEALEQRGGASGVVLYFTGKKMYVANAGNALAVISRGGHAEPVSTKHDPYDRRETARIRAAEGWISPTGLVNDEIDISRSFGFFHLLPVVNARPDIISWELSELDEFVIVANRGLWDFVSYETAVDIARRERGDPMIAAQKLRDFAMSYGADGSTMIMVISVADLFKTEESRSREESIVDSQMFKPLPRHMKDNITDVKIRRLQDEVPPPTGHLALVFTDIRNSTHLWEVNRGMNTAWRIHNSLLRRILRFCGGYEVKTEGDAFMCAFPTTMAAVWWCLSVQKELLEQDWPLEILECEDGKPIVDYLNRVIAQGLSVRMGIHCGAPLCEKDPVNHRMDYFGPMVNRSARIQGSAAGGQIMCSADVIREINAHLKGGPPTPFSELQPAEAIDAIRRMNVTVVDVGEVKLKGLELPETLSAIYPDHLIARHDLREPAPDADASGSRVQFSVSQIRRLGLVCLRLEALATSRIFREMSERKSSIQTVSDRDEEEDSLYLYGDPNLLLPPLNEKSSDRDMTLALDALSGRIENAVSSLKERTRTQSAKEALVSLLKTKGSIDERTLLSVLGLLEGL